MKSRISGSDSGSSPGFNKALSNKQLAFKDTFEEEKFNEEFSTLFHKRISVRQHDNSEDSDN